MTGPRTHHEKTNKRKRTAKATAEVRYNRPDPLAKPMFIPRKPRHNLEAKPPHNRWIFSQPPSTKPVTLPKLKWLEQKD